MILQTMLEAVAVEDVEAEMIQVEYAEVRTVEMEKVQTVEDAEVDVEVDVVAIELYQSNRTYLGFDD